MAIDPLTQLILSALGAGAGGIASSISNRNAQAQQIQATRDNTTANIAEDESKLNPFRQQLDQAHTIGALDMAQNARISPAKVAVSGRYASAVPQMSGGFSYAPSQEYTDSAGALKRDVMLGHSAPTMTNPSNYGKTSALDLSSLINRVNGAPAGDIPDDLVPDYVRRKRNGITDTGLPA